MKVLVTGGTGFVGKALVAALIGAGHTCVIVSRRPSNDNDSIRYIEWSKLEPELRNVDAVINLAGENIAGGLWTTATKHRILESRVSATSGIASVIKKGKTKVSVFLSASASGFYGDCGDRICTENAPVGAGFLSDVCLAWERPALSVSDVVRVAIPRIGVVLEKDGGALAAMAPLFKLYLGGPVGGSQYVPWIHRMDLVRQFLWLLHNPEASGVYNASAPEPVTMAAFSHALADALSRPSMLTVPGFLVRMVLGEASEPLLGSVRSVPEKFIQQGFEFRYPKLDEALTAIYSPV